MSSCIIYQYLCRHTSTTWYWSLNPQVIYGLGFPLSMTLTLSDRCRTVCSPWYHLGVAGLSKHSPRCLDRPPGLWQWPAFGHEVQHTLCPHPVPADACLLPKLVWWGESECYVRPYHVRHQAQPQVLFFSSLYSICWYISHNYNCFFFFFIFV